MPANACRFSALAVVLVVVAAHLLIAPTVDLSVDEAHYALYARFLDWSYFDHPPLVGWILWLLTPLGMNEFTLRLPPVLIYAACSYLLYRISAHRLEGASPCRGALTVALFSTYPIVQLLGFGLVPEFPLLLWSLLIALLVPKLNPESPLTHWLGLGLLLGLAGLSKYTAVLLVFSLGLYWLLEGKLGAILRSGKLWAAALIGLLCITPVLWWNLHHDWASFAYQIDHAAGGEWEFEEVLRTLLIQLITYSPLAVIGGFAVLRDIGRPGLRRLLVCMALPVLAFVLIGSGNGDSLPHWSLLAWTLLTPAVSGWVIDRWQRRPVRWLACFGVGMSVSISTLALLILASKPLGLIPWAAPGLIDLYGWQEAALKARALTREHDGEDGIILVSNWSRASRIAWYAWPQRVQVLDRRGLQFVDWYGEPSPQTRGILIRDDLDDDDNPSAPYRKRGLSCQPIDQQAVVVDGVEINRFHFYRCAGKPAPGR